MEDAYEKEQRLAETSFISALNEIINSPANQAVSISAPEQPGIAEEG